MEVPVGTHSKICAVLLIVCATQIIISKKTKDDSCDSNPCLNGGWCKKIKGKSKEEWKCICPDDWWGTICELNDTLISTTDTNARTSSPGINTTQTEPTTITTSKAKITTTFVHETHRTRSSLVLGTTAERLMSNAKTTTDVSPSPGTVLFLSNESVSSPKSSTAPSSNTAPLLQSISEAPGSTLVSSTSPTPLFGTTGWSTTSLARVKITFAPLKRIEKGELEKEEAFSESDQRISATTFGITAVGIMSLVIAAIVLFDIITAWHHIRRLNCIGNIRNFRNITLKEMCIECWCSKSKIFRRKRKKFRMTYVIYKYRQYQKQNGGPDVTFSSMLALVFNFVIGKIKTFCCDRRNVNTGSNVTLINNNNERAEPNVNCSIEIMVDSEKKTLEQEFESVSNMSKLYSDTKDIQDTVILEEEIIQDESFDGDNFESIKVMQFDLSPCPAQNNKVKTEMTNEDCGIETEITFENYPEPFEAESCIYGDLENQMTDGKELDTCSETPDSINNMPSDEISYKNDLENYTFDIESIDNIDEPNHTPGISEYKFVDELRIANDMDSHSEITCDFSNLNDGSDEELTIPDETEQNFGKFDLWDPNIEESGSEIVHSPNVINSLKLCKEDNHFKAPEKESNEFSNETIEASIPTTGPKEESRESFTSEGDTNRHSLEQLNSNDRKCLSSAGTNRTLETGRDSSRSSSITGFSPKSNKEFLFPDPTQDWAVLSSSLPSSYLTAVRDKKLHAGIGEYPQERRTVFQEYSLDDAITKPGVPKVVCWHEGYNARVKPPKNWMKIVRDGLKSRAVTRDSSFTASLENSPASLKKKRRSLPSVSIKVDDIYQESSVF